VKGSLRGGVLFGVAYAAAYARAILATNLKKSALKQLLLDLLWLHFLVFWSFVASFPFILAFCGFISFHFGLLCLPQKCLVCVAKRSMAASFIPPKNFGAYLYGWGYQLLTRGLRGGYAALTPGELVASVVYQSTSQFPSRLSISWIVTQVSVSSSFGFPKQRDQWGSLQNCNCRIHIQYQIISISKHSSCTRHP